MSNNSTTQSVQIVRQAPKNIAFTYEELEQKCVKVMEGHGHIAENMDYWDFIDKNKWALSTVLSDKTKILYGSFAAPHNCVYHAYLCKKCEGIFQVPFEVTKCMFCDHTELAKERKKTRVRDMKNGRMGLTEGVNPELYAMAVKDIQEHEAAPTEPEVDLDWDWLESQV